MDTQAELTLTETHGDLNNALKHLESGKPVIVHQQGQPVAALISIEDLHLLERLVEEEEDRIDLAETEKILADMDKEGTIAWETIKAEAGL